MALIHPVKPFSDVHIFGITIPREVTEAEMKGGAKSPKSLRTVKMCAPADTGRSSTAADAVERSSG